MKYLFDANSCIYLLSGAYPALTARVADTEAGASGISSIAFAEVSLDTHRLQPPIQSLLDAFALEIPVLPFDEAAARVYAKLPYQRGSYDRRIAAHALSRGLILITRNTRDFADIAELKYEDWSVR